MKKENSTQKEKLQFFARMKKAIFNLEKYSDFANEKISTTIKFLCLFVLIFVIFQTGIYGLKCHEMIGKITTYIENELTDFDFRENVLSASKVSTAYDEENDFYFAMDTKNENELNTYRDEMKKHSMGMVFTSKDAYIYSAGEEYIYSYAQLLEGSTTETLNKQKLLESLQGEEKVRLILIIVSTVILLNYPTTLFAYVLQVLAVGFAVWISAKIFGLRLSYSSSCSIAVYSMVLSSLLSIIYSIVNSFTEFRIVNFDLMYNIIIYIYAMFSVFMLKIDAVKQTEEIIKEVRKIEKVQEEVHEEMQAAKESEKQEENKQEEKGEQPIEEEKEEALEESTENTEENNEKEPESKEEKIDEDEPIKEPKAKKNKAKGKKK